MPNTPTPPDNPWMRRQLNLPPDEAIAAREITQEDIDYLRKYKFPFLQIANEGPSVETYTPPIIMIGPSGGWPIHDGGNTINASPGLVELDVSSMPDKTQPASEEKAAGKKEKKEEAGEGEEGEGAATLSAEESKGTIINQTVMTAFDMVTMALAKGWESLKIIEGSELMKWAAWAAAQDAGLKAYGFTPSESDKKKYDRLRGLSKEAGGMAISPHLKL